MSPREIDLSLGKSYYWLESEREAGERFEHGLHRLEQKGLPRDQVTLELVGNLVNVKTDMGDLPQFIGHAVDILNAGSASLGPLHPAVIDLRGHLASAHLALGQWQTALAEYRQLLQDKQRATPDDAKSLGLAHFAIGWVQGDLADYAAADAELRSSIALLMPALGEESLDVANSHAALGGQYVDAGRYADGETELDIAMHTYRKWEEEDRGEILGVQTDRARSALYQGRLDDASKGFQAVIDALGHWNTGEKDQTAPMREGLALVYQQQGHLAEAVESMRDARDSSAAVYGIAHPQTRRMRVELAEILLSSGQIAEANESLDKEPAVNFDDLPADHPLHAELLRVGGLLSQQKGDVAGARTSIQNAVRIFSFATGRQSLEDSARARQSCTRTAAVKGSCLTSQP